MKKALLCLFFAALLSVPALAVDTGAPEEALPDEAREILGDMTVEDAMTAKDIPQRLWDWVKAQTTPILAEAARSAGVAVAAALLCSAAGAASPDGKTPDYVIMGGALAVMGACAGDIRSFLGQVTDALGELSDLSKALLPCMAAASAAAGHSASGAARYTVSALFLDVLSTLSRDAVLPLLYAYSAVSTANAALPGGALNGPVKLIAWGCKTLLTALTTVFTLCLTLSGIIAGAGDKLAGSVAKTAISAALPVVGKILSDAADTYLAGAAMLRGAVGIFGLAAVLCVCLGPALRLGARYVLFKAAQSVCEPFTDGRLSALLGHIASCCGMALGLLGSAGVMLFMSVVFSVEVFTG